MRWSLWQAPLNVPNDLEGFSECLCQLKQESEAFDL